MFTPTLAICVQLSDTVSAHILYRLFWWVTNNPEKKSKDAFKWNANPSSWWAQQTGLSITQVDRAIAKLVKLKLIVVECRPRGNLLRCRWIRLSDECAQTILANLDSQSSAGAQVISFEGDSTDPANTTAPSKDSSKEKLKAPISDLAVGEIASPTIISKQKSQKAFNKDSLHTLWKSEVHAATGNWVADFSAAEWKFAALLIQKTFGQDLAGALKLAVHYWGDFQSFVAKAKGIDCGKIANNPQIYTAMLHPTELIAFAKEKSSELAQQAEWKAKSLNQKSMWA